MSFRLGAVLLVPAPVRGPGGWGPSLLATSTALASESVAGLRTAGGKADKLVVSSCA